MCRDEPCELVGVVVLVDDLPVEEPLLLLDRHIGYYGESAFISGIIAVAYS